MLSCGSHVFVVGHHHFSRGRSTVALGVSQQPLLACPNEAETCHTIRKPNGWFRWLYIFIRYFPLAVEATLTGLFAHTGLQTHRPWRICDIEVTVEGVLLELVILSVQVILLVRVYILYNRRKVVLVVLLALLAASV
ncbi:hypothetical protein BD310DRAFT_921640, partial [Dichomitus squalens]